MNVLLVEAHELTSASTCVLSGRRAEHLRDVLKVDVGSTVRAGIVDGGLGTATVQEMAGDTITVAVAATDEAPATADALLLAIPRPKVLMRMLSHAAAMGFARIVLFRSWRVDKTWMQSRAMDPAVQREQLLLGLEQGGRTRVPEVQRFDLFKPMVEDHLPALALPPQRFVAHPTAATPTHELQLTTGPFSLAIGPDGGFLPYEVEKLQAEGFRAITCGPHALRTETALAALWGQLDLLRRQG